MTDTTTTELAKVTLDFPFVRGDKEIAMVQVRRPRSGELRGLNIADLVQMNVASTAKLLPRITIPPLTEAEINNLDPSDLTQFGMEIQDFLLPKAAKEQDSQA